MLHPPDAVKDGIFGWARRNRAEIVLQAWGTEGGDGSYGMEAAALDVHLAENTDTVAVVASGGDASRKGDSSLQSYAMSKNAIVVGASEAYAEALKQGILRFEVFCAESIIHS